MASLGSVAKLGEACLGAATGKNWVYSPEFSRFVTEAVLSSRAALRQLEKDVVAQIEELDRDSADMASEADDLLAEARDRNLLTIRVLEGARDARAAARAEEVKARTLVACETLRAANEVEALTNPVCPAIYVANGFPQD